MKPESFLLPHVSHDVRTCVLFSKENWSSKPTSVWGRRKCRGLKKKRRRLWPRFEYQHYREREREREREKTVVFISLVEASCVQSAAATDLLHVKHNLGDPDDVSDSFRYPVWLLFYNHKIQHDYAALHLFRPFSLFLFLSLSFRSPFQAYSSLRAFKMRWAIHDPWYYGVRRDKGKSPVSLLLRLKND